MVLFSVIFMGTAVSAGPYEDLADAVKKGDIVKMKTAIAKGADVNQLDAQGKTSVLTSAMFYPEAVKLLLGSGADPNAGAYPPLLNAATHGCVEAARLLLEKGADPNKGAYGTTPIQAALASTRAPELVRLLVNAGVKTDIKDAMGQNLLFAWVTIDYPARIEGFKKLIPDYEGKYGYKLPDWWKNQNHSITPEQLEEVLKLLTGKGVKINEANMFGFTPFTDAIKYGKSAQAKILINNGVDPKKAVKFSSTKTNFVPICMAALNCDLDVMKLIVEKGGNVNDSVTSLDLISISYNGFTKGTGYTPLNLALIARKPDVASYLLDRGGDPNVPVSGNAFLTIGGIESEGPFNHEIDGKTAIFWAIETGDRAIVEKIAEKIKGKPFPTKFTVKVPGGEVSGYSGGKRVTYKISSSAMKPSEWAEKLGKSEIAELLKSRGL